VSTTGKDERQQQRRTHVPRRLMDAGDRLGAAPDGVTGAPAMIEKRDGRLVAFDPGRIGRAIARAAAEVMLVMGASGQTTSPQVLLGSGAAELTRRVTVPVAVVRDIPDNGRASVIIGVDGSPASVRAVRSGFDVAARRGLGVVAVVRGPTCHSKR